MNCWDAAIKASAASPVLQVPEMAVNLGSGGYVNPVFKARKGEKQFENISTGLLWEGKNVIYLW